jgi:hypothetical protein
MSEQLGNPEERAEQIARLNDAFRKAGPAPGWYMTPGAIALPDGIGLIRAVMTFDYFAPDNDPYGEHDFGNFSWHQEKVYFKIDYYDRQLRYWCDPLRAECRRILTILLASEY